MSVMANLVVFVALALLVAVSAERISSSRDTVSSSRDRNLGSSFGSDRNTGSNLGSDSDFGFDNGRQSASSSASRTGSANFNRNTNSAASGAGWMDSDDSDSDLATPKIAAWKGGVIPYDVASDISASNTAALKRMFQDISDKTCLRFVPKISSDANYVQIKSGNKCSAPLGMSSGSMGSSSGRQSSLGLGSSSAAVSNVVLGQSCWTTKRVGRRIMNLLGIPHETSRPDRDQFVEINFKNLRTGYANNVKQISASAYLPGVLDVPYDTNSITQYTDDDLAKDTSTWAIRAKSGSSTLLGGDGFSSLDFEKIRRAYNCPRSSSSSSGSNSGRGSLGQSGSGSGRIRNSGF